MGIDAKISQIQIGEHTINYLEAGAGEPLLLIHGANFGWGQWYKNIPALAKKFRVIAIDLPGAGRSSRIDYARLDPEKDFYEVVRGFIERLRLDNLQIVGVSMGGWVTLQIALKSHFHLKRIVVVNSVGFVDYMSASDLVIGLYPLASFIASTILRPKRNNKNIERFLRNIFFDKQLNLASEFINYFYETMSTSHNLLFISRLTALHKELSLESRLSLISIPTLIVWGSNDKIIPYKKNKENVSLIPAAKVCLIDNCGHIPPLEKEVEFNECLSEFLSK